MIGAHVLTLVDVSGRAYQVDVTSYEAIAATTEAVIREFNGRLDVFVANSGIPWTQGAALDGGLDHYHKIMKTDVDSAFYCARVAG
jgi:sorbose reductase